ncbi:uncharacterized protein PgNI_00453 [Pyricularia grisea]|uniref:Uncharacterized protein n=1 Tax=Pyricularia grisea TaxID=148305 RepID=A0A6P8BFP0_PYRGI|nr:uncharacterized protein PgNI_00453 [Pyricularia grisea]TLD15467.1 hypothetical protein PgNI_00453 [Pyricularia grisea]
MRRCVSRFSLARSAGGRYAGPCTSAASASASAICASTCLWSVATRPASAFTSAVCEATATSDAEMAAGVGDARPSSADAAAMASRAAWPSRVREASRAARRASRTSLLLSLVSVPSTAVGAEPSSRFCSPRCEGDGDSISARAERSTRSRSRRWSSADSLRVARASRARSVSGFRSNVGGCRGRNLEASQASTNDQSFAVEAAARATEGEKIAAFDARRVGSTPAYHLVAVWRVFDGTYGKSRHSKTKSAPLVG